MHTYWLKAIYNNSMEKETYHSVYVTKVSKKL